jgi:hypothetical protein
VIGCHLFANELYRFVAIAALTDDFQIVLLLEQLHNDPAGKWLIIDDKDATLHVLHRNCETAGLE